MGKGCLQGQVEGTGHEAPGPAQGNGLIGSQGADHRIVARDVDVPVVQQKGVRQGGQIGAGGFIGVRQGLFAEIAAGHHQGRGGLVQEQQVQRGIGQHQAQVLVARGHVRGKRTILALSGQDDGPFPGQQQPALRLAQVAELLGFGQVPDHHREGLGHPALALAQGRHRLILAGVRRQMKAPQALDRHDLAVSEQPGRGLQGACGQGLPTRFLQPEVGAADRAGGGLGVEAPVFRVLILGPAGVAHGKDRHGGVAAVVGDRLDNGEAGAAIGAIGKRILIAAVTGVQDFSEAGVAGGDVGGDQGFGGRLAPALQNDKAGLSVGFGLQGHHGIHPGQVRGLVGQLLDKLLQGVARPFHLDFHAGGGVTDPAGQVVGLGQPIDERPEADALHHAGDLQLFSGDGFRAGHAPVNSQGKLVCHSC